MRRLLLLSLFAVLAIPAADASGARPKLSPKASAVSAGGVAKIEAANPNRYALRGKATVTVRGETVASRNVRLAKRSVSEVGLRFNAKALDALRAAGGRATVTLELRRSGSTKTLTARRTLTLALPAAPQAPPSPQAAPPAPPAPAASNRWVGRMGTEGAYDDFEFTVDNGQMTITKPAMVPVSCGEMGASNRIALSLELFDTPGPWTIGTDSTIDKSSIAVNTLANPGSKTITYKVSEASQTPGRVAGKLSIFFSDSKLDILNGSTMIFITCAGTQSFEAIPAP
jgi:hypothetical protein